MTDEASAGRIVADVANQAGVLGVEIADIAGQVDQLSHAAQRQTAAFGGLRAAAEAVMASNERIAAATAGARGAAESAAAEMASSRQTLDASMQAIGILADAVAALEHQAGDLTASLAG